MGWLGKSEYNCPECDGDGVIECGECGNEYDCSECNGTGWDTEQIDVDAFKKACDEQQKRTCSSPYFRGCGASEWIEDGKRLGRRMIPAIQEVPDKIAVSDFAYDKDEDFDDQDDDQCDELDNEDEHNAVNVFIKAPGQKHLFDKEP